MHLNERSVSQVAGGITVKFELGVPYKGSLSLAELDLKDAFRQTCVASFAITRRSGQILKYAIGVNRGWNNVSPASEAWNANGNVRYVPYGYCSYGSLTLLV